MAPNMHRQDAPVIDIKNGDDCRYAFKRMN
jgi:hypothetical protein